MTGAPNWTTPSASDELTHPIGPEPWWNESWYFDFQADDGSLGGYVRLGLYPNQGVAWYWACLVRDGQPFVSVFDHAVPLPKPGSLEIRTSGLWADHTCETPLDHWSLGCEAMALAVDDATDLLTSDRGDTVPFGLDLEWYTAGGVLPYPGVTRYEVPCRVHGEILLADERIEFDGWGERDHSWGVRDWWGSPGWVWSAGRFDDGTQFHQMTAKVPPPHRYSPGFVVRPESESLEPTWSFLAVETVDARGVVTDAQWSFEGIDVAVTPLHQALVPMARPDGTPDHLNRALCRFDAADGRVGHGWGEWKLNPTD